MTKAETIRLQHRLNAFTKTFLKGLGHIKVDGDLGPSTKGRVRTCKFMLGYRHPINPVVNDLFLDRLQYPRKRKYSSRRRLARALRRRIAGRARWARTRAKAHVTSGVSTYDGRPVAAWMRPYLVWARGHGWHGTLNSGWRDPAYSRSLCYRMCGAPSCAGRCAGSSSNHSGSVKPRGAVDVSDYVRFGQLMRACPYGPRIFNALGVRDPVHFSAQGN